MLLYRNDNGSCIVREDRSRVFRMGVDGKYVAFNVDYLPPDKHQWFCEVVGRLFREVANHSSLKAKKEITNQFKKLFMIGD